MGMFETVYISLVLIFGLYMVITDRKDRKKNYNSYENIKLKELIKELEKKDKLNDRLIETQHIKIQLLEAENNLLKEKRRE